MELRKTSGNDGLQRTGQADSIAEPDEPDSGASGLGLIFRSACILICGALFLAGCASSGKDDPDTQTADLQQQPEFLTSTSSEALLDVPQHLCPFGLPQLTMALVGREVELIGRSGYTILHDNGRKVPLFVCEELVYADVHGQITGRVSWRTDPQLCDNRTKCAKSAVNDDYTNSGFNRGHLAPNMNQRASGRRKRETFFFSNAAPQVGLLFNQSVWKRLEQDLSVLTCAASSVATITGTGFYDEALSRITVPEQTIGDGEVAVPSHFYKIVVWAKNGEQHGFVIVMKNMRYSSGTNYADFVRPISFVEELTGINFMPDVQDQDILFRIGPDAIPAAADYQRCNEICPSGSHC